MAKHWYVVHAYSGFEHAVARSLKDRIARAGMEEKFGEVLVPTEEVIEMRGGQKRRSERKFFPGYVLVQIETHDAGKAPRCGSRSSGGCRRSCVRSSSRISDASCRARMCRSVPTWRRSTGLST